MEAHVDWTITRDVEGVDEEGCEIESADYALIRLIYVPVNLRGRGIARKILRDAIKVIKAAHQDIAIRLCALPKEDTVDIDRLVNFYEKEGFSVDDEQCSSGVIMTM